MKILTLLFMSLLALGCANSNKSKTSDSNQGKIIADCQVLDVNSKKLHKLKRVDNTQRFESLIGDVRVGVTMEDPFLFIHNSINTVVRWRYFILSSGAELKSFRQESFISKGRGSLGEFLVTYSPRLKPNYEQLITSFQNHKGHSLRLYCLNTVVEADSTKKILLKESNGNYYRSSDD